MIKYITLKKMSLSVHPEQEDKDKLSQEKNEEDQEEKTFEVKPWVQYFYPAILTKLLGKKWITFALIVGFYYLI